MASVRYDGFIKRIQTRVAFGWLRELSGEKSSFPRTFYNQSILRFDVILQHDNTIHIGVFLGGKTKRPCFDLFIHWLIKQITNTYRNHFLRSYENRSIATVAIISFLKFVNIILIILAITPVASPQTSFGVQCVTNKPQRTSAGRLLLLRFTAIKLPNLV